MSTDELQRLVNRLTDPDFRERLERDPEATIAEFDLTPTEVFALSINDADGLRRLGVSEMPWDESALRGDTIRSCPAPTHPNTCSALHPTRVTCITRRPC